MNSSDKSKFGVMSSASSCPA